MPEVKKDHFVLDVDGVLLDMTAAVQEYIANTFQASVPERCVTAWDYAYCLGLDRRTMHELWDYVWDTPLDPYPGATKFIRVLKGMGYTVVGLSSRPQHWTGLEDTNAANKAAERDFPQLGLDYFLLVDHGRDKAEKINEMWPGAKFCLEDNPQNARDIGERTKTHSLLLNRPWNQHCTQIRPFWDRIYTYDAAIGLAYEALR